MQHENLFRYLENINSTLESKYDNNRLAIIIDKFIECFNRDDFVYLESIFNKEKLKVPPSFLPKAKEALFLASAMNEILNKIKNINN